MKRRIILSVSTAVAIVLLSSQAAFAGSNAYARLLDSCGGSYGDAWAYFNADGEIFTAYDNCVDGHSAVTRWKIGTSSTIHTLWDHSGAGGGDDATFNGAIAEGVTVRVQACTGEYGDRSIVQCTAWGATGSVGAA